MTGPGEISQPPPVSAEVVSSAIQQMVRDSQTLGITWSLRIATIRLVTSTLILGSFDGDLDNTQLTLTTMTPNVGVGNRVYVMSVPPGGNFIVGWALPIPATAGNMYAVTGTFLVSTAGAEAAVPTASWTLQPLFEFHPGQIYALQYAFNPISSGATNLYGVFRVRMGAASTSGTVLTDSAVFVNTGGLAINIDRVGYIKNTTTSVISTYLSLSVQNATGADFLRIWGAGSTSPTHVTALHVGSIIENPDLAAMAVAIA